MTENQNNEYEIQITRHISSCGNLIKLLDYSSITTKYLKLHQPDPSVMVWGIIQAIIQSMEWENLVKTNQIFVSNTIFVSNMFRTWITAFLLYSAHMTSDTLNFVISPYIREHFVKEIASENIPALFSVQIKKFINVLEYLILIANIDTTSNSSNSSNINFNKIKEFIRDRILKSNSNSNSRKKIRLMIRDNLYYEIEIICDENNNFFVNHNNDNNLTIIEKFLSDTTSLISRKHKITEVFTENKKSITPKLNETVKKYLTHTIKHINIDTEFFKQQKTYDNLVEEFNEILNSIPSNPHNPITPQINTVPDPKYLTCKLKDINKYKYNGFNVNDISKFLGWLVKSGNKFIPENKKICVVSHGQTMRDHLLYLINNRLDSKNKAKKNDTLNKLRKFNVNIENLNIWNIKYSFDTTDNNINITSQLSFTPGKYTLKSHMDSLSSNNNKTQKSKTKFLLINFDKLFGKTNKNNKSNNKSKTKKISDKMLYSSDCEYLCDYSIEKQGIDKAIEKCNVFTNTNTNTNTKI